MVPEGTRCVLDMIDLSKDDKRDSSEPRTQPDVLGCVRGTLFLVGTWTVIGTIGGLERGLVDHTAVVGTTTSKVLFSFSFRFVAWINVHVRMLQKEEKRKRQQTMPLYSKQQ